eukprot:GSA25T00015708001.1
MHNLLISASEAVSGGVPGPVGRSFSTTGTIEEQLQRVSAASARHSSLLAQLSANGLIPPAAIGTGRVSFARRGSMGNSGSPSNTLASGAGPTTFRGPTSSAFMMNYRRRARSAENAGASSSASSSSRAGGVVTDSVHRMLREQIRQSQRRTRQNAARKNYYRYRRPRPKSVASRTRPKVVACRLDRDLEFTLPVFRSRSRGDKNVDLSNTEPQAVHKVPEVDSPGPASDHPADAQNKDKQESLDPGGQQEVQMEKTRVALVGSRANELSSGSTAQNTSQKADRSPKDARASPIFALSRKQSVSASPGKSSSKRRPIRLDSELQAVLESNYPTIAPSGSSGGQGNPTTEERPTGVVDGEKNEITQSSSSMGGGVVTDPADVTDATATAKPESQSEILAILKAQLEGRGEVPLIEKSVTSSTIAMDAESADWSFAVTIPQSGAGAFCGQRRP